MAWQKISDLWHYSEVPFYRNTAGVPVVFFDNNQPEPLQ